MLYQAPYEAFYISYVIQNFQPLYEADNIIKFYHSIHFVDEETETQWWLIGTTTHWVSGRARIETRSL